VAQCSHIGTKEEGVVVSAALEVGAKSLGGAKSGTAAPNPRTCRPRVQAADRYELTQLQQEGRRWDDVKRRCGHEALMAEEMRATALIVAGWFFTGGEPGRRDGWC
jgi:hypothetical protein